MPARLGRDRGSLLAEDEDAVGGAELAAEVVEDEVAVRTVHVDARHVDVAVLPPARPAGVLTQGDDPDPLLHLFGVAREETGEVAGVGQNVAGGNQALRSLLARLSSEERLDPHFNRLDIRPLERETLRGNIGVEVAVVARAEGALDQIHQTEGLVVGDRETDELLGTADDEVEHEPDHREQRLQRPLLFVFPAHDFSPLLWARLLFRHYAETQGLPFLLILLIFY